MASGKRAGSAAWIVVLFVLLLTPKLAFSQAEEEDTITFSARRMESVIAKGKEKTILIGGAVVNTGSLKIKVASSIVAISSIHLLRSFINTSNLSEHTLRWEITIHVVLVLSALVLMLTDWMLTKRMAQAHPPVIARPDH